MCINLEASFLPTYFLPPSTLHDRTAANFSRLFIRYATLLLTGVNERNKTNVKPWPNGLASRCKFPKPDHLYGLAMGGQTDS